MQTKRFCLLLFFIIVHFHSFSQYTIATIPNPKHDGQNQFVSNPDGILSSSELENINTIAEKIESSSKAEIAIVAIDDYEGDMDDFQFAYEQFQHWGIGKKETNNGLLLLVVKDRRKYRFITGYGLEGLLPDVTLKQIGEMDLVPDFKNGNYGTGIENAMADIEKILLSPNGQSELKNLYFRKTSKTYLIGTNLLYALLILIVYGFLDRRAQKFEVKLFKKRTQFKKYRPTNLYIGFGALLFLFFIGIFLFGFFHIKIYSWSYTPIYAIFIGSIALALGLDSIYGTITSKNFDIADSNYVLNDFLKTQGFSFIFSPFSWFTLSKLLRLRKQNNHRMRIGPEGENWRRLHYVDEKKIFKHLLTNERMKEIELGVIVPEFWINTVTNQIKSVDWHGINFSHYISCPQCHTQTYEKGYQVKTIQKATYSRSGKGEKIRKCFSCGYILSLGMVTLPRLVESSSSSSSSSGSSSSSSSSGSWGGGSSGGGGAGGSW